MAEVIYSGIYFRPVDTKANKAGWYIKQTTITHMRYNKKEIVIKELYFESEQEAKEFELLLGGDFSE